MSTPELKLDNYPQKGENSTWYCVYCYSDNRIAEQQAIESGLSYQAKPILTGLACSKCGQHFCPQFHASKIDARFCLHCMKEVVITDSTYEKIEEEYDEDNDTLVRHKSSCRQITFGGADWWAYTRAIATLSKEELKQTIEYHKAMVAQLEGLIVQRKIETEKELLARSMRGGIGSSTVRIKKTTERRTKTTAKATTVDLNQIVAQLKNAGVSPELLQQLLNKQIAKQQEQKKVDDARTALNSIGNGKDAGNSNNGVSSTGISENSGAKENSKS